MSVWGYTTSYQQARQFMLCALAVAAFGCGSGDGKITGKVTGKVTYQGAPVTAGVVYLNSSATGAGGTGVLGDDGKFTIAESIEAGEYKVTVTPPPPPPPRADQATPPPVSKVSNIPNKYWTEAKSDLKATVDAGANVLEFDLKP